MTSRPLPESVRQETIQWVVLDCWQATQGLLAPGSMALNNTQRFGRPGAPFSLSAGAPTRVHFLTPCSETPMAPIPPTRATVPIASKPRRTRRRCRPMMASGRPKISLDLAVSIRMIPQSYPPSPRNSAAAPWASSTWPGRLRWPSRWPGCAPNRVQVEVGATSC